MSRVPQLEEQVHGRTRRAAAAAARQQQQQGAARAHGACPPPDTPTRLQVSWGGSPNITLHAAHCLPPFFSSSLFPPHPAPVRDLDDEDELRFGVHEEMLYARNRPPVEGAQWTGVVTQVCRGWVGGLGWAGLHCCCCWAAAALLLHDCCCCCDGSQGHACLGRRAAHTRLRQQRTKARRRESMHSSCGGGGPPPPLPPCVRRLR